MAGEEHMTEDEDVSGGEICFLLALFCRNPESVGL